MVKTFIIEIINFQTDSIEDDIVSIYKKQHNSMETNKTLTVHNIKITFNYFMERYE